MNFIIAVVFGLGLGTLFDVNDFIYHSIWFDTLSTFALLVGLYGSVYGINKNKLFENKNIIISAVTIGVVLKIFIIGVAFYGVTGHIAWSFLLATIIAQIDPLSVASLEESNLSERGNTILKAWASFDDPMTVIISVWISVLMVGGDFNLVNLALDVFYNILFAYFIYIIYKKIKAKNQYQLLLLFFAFIVAIPFKLFLGIAIVAIYLKPNIENEIEMVIKMALFYVSIVMGILIAHGINVIEGIFLGIFTILAQFITAWLLTKELEFKDRVQLSIAQQSGITAITLAVYFSNLDSGIVETIAVAILTINVLYFLLNKLYLKVS